MKQYKIKLPLRDDHTVVLIVANRDDSELLCKMLGVDEEWMAKKDAIAVDTEVGTFYIVLFSHKLSNLVHELDHIVFYVMERFELKDQEFHCMLLEYLFIKFVKYLPDKV